MADNVTLSAGSGDGATFKTDDDGTAHWPYTKLAFGADNTQSIVTSTATNPLPVALSDTDNAVLDNIDTDTSNIATAVQLIDDAICVDDADWTDDTSKHILTGGVYQSSPHTVTDGDVTPFLTDANGRLAVSVGNTVTVASHAVTNAGTFAVQVDGSSLTALQLIDDPVFADDAAFTAATSKVMMIGGQFQGTPNTLDDGDAGSILLDASHRVVIVNTGTFVTQENGSLLTAAQLIDDPVFADDAAFTAATSKVMMVGGQYQSSPNALDDGDAGSILLDSSHRIVLAPGSSEKTDDAAFTPGTTGVVCIGMQADETAADSVDEGDAGCPRMTLNRYQIVTNRGHASSGATGFTSVDLDETEEQVSATACTVYSIYVWNTTAAPKWLQMWNATAANVTPGTTAPTYNFMIPANADSDGAGVSIPLPVGLVFSTALSVAVTGAAGTDATDPGASAAGIFLTYQA